MKKIEIKFLKSYNALILGLMSLLGFFSACEKRVEYGVPSAKFIVNGQVSSIESNEVIKNIQVTMVEKAVLTDDQGKFQMIDAYGFPGSQTYSIHFVDVDSTLNGEFETLDTIVEFKNPVFTDGDGNWYQGETSTQFNVKLKSK